MKLKCCIFYVLIVSLLAQVVYGSEFTVISTTEKSFEKNDAISNLTSRLDSLESQLNTLNHHVTKIGKSLEKICMAIPKPDNKHHYPENCVDVKKRGNNASGVYSILPRLSSTPFAVFCDMNTKGGSWTYFLNRFDGSLDFYKNWDSYKNGFGSLTEEFWLGLEYLHSITESENNEFLVEVTDWNDWISYARYDALIVGDEKSGYALKIVGQYTGDAENRMTGFYGMKFTTFDKDQDAKSGDNCAERHHGAWWYNDCTVSNPTSTYFHQAQSTRWDVMFWYSTHDFRYCPKKLKMMVRPKCAY